MTSMSTDNILRRLDAGQRRRAAVLWDKPPSSSFGWGHFDSSDSSDIWRPRPV